MYWKARFSRCIYHKSQVYIFQNWRYRWLAFESMTIQTLIHRRHPERIELNYIEALILAARDQPGETCVLGLGGAGVMHALAPFYQNNTPCLAIEHNPTVIEAAHAYFFLEKLAFLHIEEADAYTYLASNNTKFDHLLVDIFNATTFPEHCNSLDFVELCKKNLKPEGVLAVNFANIQAQMPLVRALKQCFAREILFISLPKTTNLVALCFYESGLQSFLIRLSTDPRLRSLSWQPEWGHVACFRDKLLA